MKSQADVSRVTITSNKYKCLTFFPIPWHEKSGTLGLAHPGALFNEWRGAQPCSLHDWIDPIKAISPVLYLQIRSLIAWASSLVFYTYLPICKSLFSASSVHHISGEKAFRPRYFWIGKQRSVLCVSVCVCDNLSGFLFVTPRSHSRRNHSVDIRTREVSCQRELLHFSLSAHSSRAALCDYCLSAALTAASSGLRSQRDPCYVDRAASGVGFK